MLLGELLVQSAKEWAQGSSHISGIIPALSCLFVF